MKKTTPIKGMAAAALLVSSLFAVAQEGPKKFGKFPLYPDQTGVIKCATVENEMMLQEQNPKRATQAQFEQWISQKVKEKQFQKDNNDAILTIPVVVHVVYNSNVQKISLEQVKSQIEVLNEDFRKMEGTNGFGDNELSTDTKIQFCLAKINLDNEEFDGVDYVYTPTTQFTSRQDVEIMKSSSQWDPEMYFNIWTVAWGGSELGNLLGYAQFPEQSGLQGLGGLGGDSTTDGVAISYRNFGSKQKYPQGTYGNSNFLGRTATHEIGHCLGLRHIWGDDDNCNGNDFCNDTPVANAPSIGCDTTQDSCPQPGYDMVQNYMDYSADTCMNIFTPDQVTRMRTVLANSPRRASLLTSPVCGALSSPDRQVLEGTKVYPNPTQTVLNITVNNGELPDTYTIYNSIGQVMVNAKVGSEADLTINTSSYSNGIYFIKVDKGTETRTIKFVKN